MKTQGLRPCAAVLAVVWCLASVVALATPAEAAPPDPPSMQPGYHDVSVDYTANPEVHGNKPVGTNVIVRRVADGSSIPCLEDNPLSLSSWGCTMDQRNFPQNRDATAEAVVQLTAHAVNALGEESAGTPFTVRIQPSIFAVTTPRKLPDGDLIVIEGRREVHAADVRWTVTRGGVTLVDSQPCTLDDGREDAGELDIFACRYDSTATRSSTRQVGGSTPRRSAHARFATAVPSGSVLGRAPGVRLRRHGPGGRDHVRLHGRDSPAQGHAGHAQGAQAHDAALTNGNHRSRTRAPTAPDTPVAQHSPGPGALGAGGGPSPGRARESSSSTPPPPLRPHGRRGRRCTTRSGSW